eukprot:1764601-Rhodomonas_salina.1
MPPFMAPALTFSGADTLNLLSQLADRDLTFHDHVAHAYIRLPRWYYRPPLRVQGLGSRV